MRMDISAPPHMAFANRHGPRSGEAGSRVSVVCHAAPIAAIAVCAGVAHGRFTGCQPRPAASALNPVASGRLMTVNRARHERC